MLSSKYQGISPIPYPFWSGYREHMKSNWECLTQDETEVDKRNLCASGCEHLIRKILC